MMMTGGDGRTKRGQLTVGVMTMSRSCAHRSGLLRAPPGRMRFGVDLTPRHRSGVRGNIFEVGSAPDSPFDLEALAILP